MINLDNVKEKECFVDTQQQKAESSRPDMLLFLNKTKENNCLIESKTAFDVDKNQLRRHAEFSKVNGCCKKYILITLHYAKAPSNWIEIGEIIKSKLEHLNRNSIDSFIAQCFIEFLKEHNYMRPSRIT